MLVSIVSYLILHFTYFITLLYIYIYNICFKLVSFGHFVPGDFKYRNSRIFVIKIHNIYHFQFKFQQFMFKNFVREYFVSGHSVRPPIVSKTILLKIKSLIILYGKLLTLHSDNDKLIYDGLFIFLLLTT